MKKTNLTAEEIEDQVLQAQSGDTEAFSHLYDFFIDPIYRYVFFKVKSEDALDLTETVFLKVWENIKSYRPDRKNSSFSSWVYRIAHNVIVDHYRLAKSYEKLNFDLPDESRNNNPVYTAEEKMSQDTLKKAISRLKRSYQQVILLKYINELENHEISRIMKRSEGSLRILKFRALKALKKELQNQNIVY
jgi:RNA polymerase sigma factor (sigma-70 family)